mmetsp:Transcript_46283/g.144780  ORF Transcript_46283/g.144780 Transcript_46283/m.144780 type:complete len:589 (-) Transcript_46283:99-1865(-)|eukprot:CAMPEP_0118862192 /NCGR_PEP_ID=MMETSP1163-20130328/7481_1 /TAXON_ID=124430 /ORGANISM="Phaeomonas parva, Strain CCMP2877" /LENGTH=588 /DNA_ID=CAMNT_0006796071 /DNA_START=198 /DNA_END=1964 /DNA_ORIENTATION=+
MRGVSRGGVPGTAGGMRLNTGAGNRLGTARLRTGARGPLATPGTQAGVGMSALSGSTQVQHRPVTQQGMMGMKTSAGNRPGRQVQDLSYFIAVVRNKNTEIASETKKLSEEVEQRTSDGNQYGQLEKQYEKLVKEVRNLEGQLADYNLAMDKHRHATDPVEIRSFQAQIEQKVKEEAQEIDNIFLMRQNKERMIAEVEEHIARLHRTAAERINQLEPGKLERYHQLLEHSEKLQAETTQRQSEIDQINARIREAEMALKENSHRDEYNRLERRAMGLRREKESLEYDLKISQMDPKDAYTKLMDKVKDDKKRTEDLEQQIGITQDDVSSMRRHLTELTSGLEDRTPDNRDGGNIEKLMQRDREMTEYIDTFDEKRTEVLHNQRVAQNTIVAVLQQISQNLDSKDNLPTEQRLQDMKEEVTFKERQLKGNTQTLQDLQMHKRRTEGELEKLQTLDVNIKNELEQLASNIERWEAEMLEFENVDSLRKSAAETQAYLEDLRDKYIKRRDSIRQQVHVLSRGYEITKAQLAKSETQKELESVEKRLKYHEQNIFNLREFIETRGRETDYNSVKVECLKVTEELNHAVQQTV